MTRRTYVWRCSACQGAQLEPAALLSACPRCGVRAFGMCDADRAPELATDKHVPVMTDLWMDGVAATDGTDIGSRRKRNAYMAANDLADANDFSGVWAKQAAERSAPVESRVAERREIRETIGRLAYETKERNRGRR